MVTTTKYVLRNSDGQFYWKDKSVSSRWGFDDDFNKAYLFDSEKGAKSRLNIAGEGAEICKVSVRLEPANEWERRAEALDTIRNASKELGIPIVLPVKITENQPAYEEVPIVDDPVFIPSVWTPEDIKRTPSMYSWATFDEETGEYYSGTSYYDAEGKEITKEEYEALVGPTRD